MMIYMQDEYPDGWCIYDGDECLFSGLEEDTACIIVSKMNAKQAEIDPLRAEVARLRSLIDHSNLEETDGYKAQGPRLVKTGRILVSKDLVAQEQRITEALQTAAKHARENARLREALAKYADWDNWRYADGELYSRRMWRGDEHGYVIAEAALANETPTV